MKLENSKLMRRLLAEVYKLATNRDYCKSIEILTRDFAPYINQLPINTHNQKHISNYLALLELAATCCVNQGKSFELNDKLKAADCYSKAAEAYKQSYDNEKAAECFFKAAEAYKQSGDNEKAAECFFKAAEAYKQSGDKEKAKECVRKRYECLPLPEVPRSSSIKGLVQKTNFSLPH